MRKSTKHFSFIFLLSIMLSQFSIAQRISACGYHSFSLCSDNSIMSWGYNIDGELGIGTTTNSNIPLPISSLNNIRSITGGHTIP